MIFLILIIIASVILIPWIGLWQAIGGILIGLIVVALLI